MAGQTISKLAAGYVCWEGSPTGPGRPPQRPSRPGDGVIDETEQVKQDILTAGVKLKLRYPAVPRRRHQACPACQLGTSDAPGLPVLGFWLGT
jgi:hypothetical protein